MEVSDGNLNVPPIVDVVGDQNKETTQSNSNTADINPNEVIPSNVEEEVEVNNMTSQESYPNFSPKDVKESGNNANINTITNTNTGDKSDDGHESHTINTKAVFDSVNIPSIGDANGDSDNINTKEGWSPDSSKDEGLDDNQSGYTAPVFSMFGYLKSQITNKVDELGASDDADTSIQLQGNERNDSRVWFQKYPKRNLVIKTFDSDEISGFVKSFDTVSLVFIQVNGVMIQKIC